MGVRAHRIVKIEYGGQFFKCGDGNLENVIRNHEDVLFDDNGNKFDVTLKTLKSILRKHKSNKLDADEKETLRNEINLIEDRDCLGDDDFVTYELF